MDQGKWTLILGETPQGEWPQLHQLSEARVSHHAWNTGSRGPHKGPVEEALSCRHLRQPDAGPPGQDSRHRERALTHARNHPPNSAPELGCRSAPAEVPLGPQPWRAGNTQRDGLFLLPWVGCHFLCVFRSRNRVFLSSYVDTGTLLAQVLLLKSCS